ncbi:MAG: T9SS C-terminal target domain-containing protein [Balneolaceae bacterium]|nr:MAG: T9SS C-terminal target domain-containing protein [Balneolaceae bacterium]
MRSKLCIGDTLCLLTGILIAVSLLSLLNYNFATAQQISTHKFESQSIQQALNHAESKLLQTLDEINHNPSKHPGHTNPESGQWDINYLSRNEWTSGFFSGSLWYMYRLTGDESWKDLAITWTEDLEPMTNANFDHDTGFRIFSSFGNGYKTLNKRTYYRTLLRAANTLSRRFDPTIGAIKSWDWTGNYPVIIDNLMNLELLFWAAENSGNRSLYNIAKTHAETSLEHHMREDGSTYHVVDFDNNGNVYRKFTTQGAGPTSVWTRGQAWAIYGFTMIYRFTEDKKFLDAAEAASQYFIERLPDDFVPYYDFYEPYRSVQTKDASAAAIAASGFLELYQYTFNSLYFNTAVEILLSLSSSDYSTHQSSLSSILNKSTLHRGFGNVGTSYADYYYLEAILRYKEVLQEEFPELNVKNFLFLDQNYPNPFNNRTIIYYSLEQSGETELTVYDMTGRRIQTLVNGQMPAGSFLVPFDGSGLSSGVYIYRLRNNGTVLTRKMTLIQ